MEEQLVDSSFDPGALADLMSLCSVDLVSAVSKLINEVDGLLNAPDSLTSLDSKLELLERLLNVVQNQMQNQEDQSKDSPLDADVCLKLFDNICLKLHTLVCSSVFDVHKQKASKHLTTLLSYAFPSAPNGSRLKFVELCLDSFKAHAEEKKISFGDSAEIPSVDVFHGINVLNCALEPQSWPDAFQNDSYGICAEKIFNECLQLLSISDSSIAGKIIGMLLPKILHDDKHQHHRLQQLWTLVVDIFDQHGQKTFQCKHPTDLSERPNLLLCGLADFLFPVSGFTQFTLELFKDSTFWTLLQAGMVHDSSLTRKRSLYLLKRILDVCENGQDSVNETWSSSESCVGGSPHFWWEPSQKAVLSKTWQVVLLLLETLEEKQMHVMRPVLQRLDNLIQATYSQPNGFPFLHTSWLTTIFQRCAFHGIAQMKRWGVTECLSIDLGKSPLLQQQQEFLCQTFVSILTESSIYYKPVEITLGNCPPVSTALQRFFPSVLTALPSEIRCEFFNRLLTGICQEYWSGAALVYVMQGIANVPSALVFDTLSLTTIRELIANCGITMDIHFRGAIQCFLIQAVMKLLDGSKVSPADFAALLGNIKIGQAVERGGRLWLDLVQWLQKTTLKDEHCLWTTDSIVTYLAESVTAWIKPASAVINGCGDSAEEVTPVQSQQCLPAARLFHLTLDASLLPVQSRHQEAKTVESTLAPVTLVLASMGSHAYLSTVKADRALAFWSALMAECGKDQSSENTAFIRNTSSQCLKEILLYMERRVTEISQMSEVASIQMYMEVLALISDTVIVGEGQQQQSTLLFLSSLNPLVNVCKNISANKSQPLSLEKQLQRLASVMVLATICDIYSQHPELNDLERDFRSEMDTTVQGWTFELELEKPVEIEANIQHSETKTSHSGTTWGRLCMEYIAAQWRCLLYCLSGNERMRQETRHPDQCLTALDVISGDTIIPVVKCLTLLLPQTPVEGLLAVLNVVWSKVQEEAKNSTFWAVYELFVKLAFNHWTVCQNLSATFPVLMEFANTIFSMGEEKVGLVNVLISQLVSCWSVDNNLQSASNMIDIVIKAITFGPLHSRGKRFMHEVHCYLIGLGDQLPVNRLSTVRTKDDRLVRVLILDWLSKLRPDVPEHVTFVRHLVTKLMALQRDLLKVNSYRNFPNCLSHRQKHRLFCAVLILEQFFTEEWSDVFYFLIELLAAESQLSVRCQVEWLIIRFIHRVPKLLDAVWQELETSSKKSACLCSLLSIISHVSKLPMTLPKQEEFLFSAIPKIFPSCMDNHFMKRLYAQATLLSMWDICKRQKLERVLSAYGLVETFVKFMVENEPATKKTKKLMETFFFHFDSLNDYSIETICHTLPYLTVISDDEWIAPSYFLEVDSTWKDSDRHPLPLFNSSETLKQCPPGMWKVKSPEQDEEEIWEGDVQKKVVPWRAMLPEEDLELDLQEEYTRKRQRSGGMVLVTSLIDKLPNLGGLCRTSEIFGVSEYVINNMRYIHDKAFQLLSVTAQKWIPIREVKPHHLKTYLLEMKQEGYTLVGAEQTANSQCLTQYTFPKQTLLLLGNEKEGIPVELIQLLDVCVEIPQQGIIRSLNVHVSGALLIWEYARQQLQGHT